MNRIYKYELNIQKQQEVLLPEGYQILKVEQQAGVLHLWAIVDPNKPNVKVQIEIFGTGSSLDDKPRTHLATVQMGQFVWHVFKASP